MGCRKGRRGGLTLQTEGNKMVKCNTEEFSLGRRSLRRGERNKARLSSVLIKMDCCGGKAKELSECTSITISKRALMKTRCILSCGHSTQLLGMYGTSHSISKGKQCEGGHKDKQRENYKEEVNVANETDCMSGTRG